MQSIVRGIGLCVVILRKTAAAAAKEEKEEEVAAEIYIFIYVYRYLWRKCSTYGTQNSQHRQKESTFVRMLRANKNFFLSHVYDVQYYFIHAIHSIRFSCSAWFAVYRRALVLVCSKICAPHQTYNNIKIHIQFLSCTYWMDDGCVYWVIDTQHTFIIAWERHSVTVFRLNRRRVIHFFDERDDCWLFALVRLQQHTTRKFEI